ncbi:hypothetical protein CLU79DRAFT_830120 [Phycomyces nitens]|nr:hypothetical protein CLU79DRAFT_830120 [Phycomyces nitens]
MDPTDRSGLDPLLQFPSGLEPFNFDYNLPLGDVSFFNEPLPDDFFRFVADDQQNSTSVATISPDINSGMSAGTTPASNSNTYTESPKPSNKRQRTDDPQDTTAYTIVVGGKPFRMSWESLKSDGPDNYFTLHFQKQKTRVMHIDRSSTTFELIVRHLRGYYIRPKDDVENQALLNDARYYGLKRLDKSLREYLYVNVGGRSFRLPWDLFQKDGKQNFFNGPLMDSLYSPHHGPDSTEIPPVYIDRDPDIFADLVNLLRGYTLSIRDEAHRRNLLRDAQYYVFRQLTDKLICSHVVVDGFGPTPTPEISLHLKDIRVAQLQMPNIMGHTMEAVSNCADAWRECQVQYKHQDRYRSLVVQLTSVCLEVHSRKGIMIVWTAKDPCRDKLVKIGQSLRVGNGVSERLYLHPDCGLVVDDQAIDSLANIKHELWRRCDGSVDCQKDCSVLRLSVNRMLCGLHLVDGALVLCGVRLEALCSQRALNRQRPFLPNSNQ